MLQKFSEHIANCFHRAAEADGRAAETTDTRLRADHARMAQTWRHLARSYQFVEALETFLLDAERVKRERAVIPILAPQGSVFDPSTIAVLVAAYDKAVEAQSASVREDIARCVIEFASAGERDPDNLCSGALALCAKRALHEQESGIKYSVKREGELWHWRVFAQRDVQIAHGATDDCVLSRGEAINFASDPAKLKDDES